MSDLTISIGGGDPDELVEFVHAAFESLAEITDDIDVNVEGLEWTHPEWSKGDPCPSCGGTEFTGYALTPGRYTVTDTDGRDGEVDDELVFSDSAENQKRDDPVSLSCANSACHAQLYRAPPAFLS